MSKSEKPREETVANEPQVFAVNVKGKKAFFTRRHFIEMTTASAIVATVANCGGEDDTESSFTNAVSEAIDEVTPPGDTPVPENTPVPTNTSVPPTDTPQPTDTPTNTPVPTDTPSPTPTPIPQVTVALSSVNVRGGPSTFHPVIVVAYQDDTLSVESRLDDNSWFKVRLEDGTIAWISESVVTYDFDPATIPVEQNVPTPPPPPSPTSPPQPTAPPGTPGEVPPGQTGINYTINGQTYTLPCGSPIPQGAVCVCNCVTVPVPCNDCNDCVDTHYWYPN